MACRLFCAKPLPEPILPYCHLDPKEDISVRFNSKFRSFHSRKCTWKISSAKIWSANPIEWDTDSTLTLKHLETHGCVVSTVATDALVLKHQAISFLITDKTFNLLDQFHMKILHFCWTTFGNKITYWTKWPSLNMDMDAPEPIRTVINWTLSSKLQWNLNQSTKCFC